MENNKLLNIITNDGGKEIPVIDSREVAEMLDKRHSALMKDINGSKDGKTIGILPTLTKSNFDSVNYFIESSYIDAKGEERKCYLVTKMGCELLGNKQQGEKGILFTAKYVERFNQMEESLKSKKQLELPASYVRAIEEQQSQIQDLTNMVTNVCKDVKRIEECVGIRSKTVFDYTSYIKRKLGIKRVNDDYENIKQCIFYEFKIKRWEQLTYNDEVMNRIDSICERVSPRKERKLF